MVEAPGGSAGPGRDHLVADDVGWAVPEDFYAKLAFGGSCVRNARCDDSGDSGDRGESCVEQVLLTEGDTERFLDVSSEGNDSE